MKTILPLIFAAAALVGCTHTYVKTGAVEVSRTSFLQKIEMPSVEFTTNGTAKLTGYKTDGGADAAAAITAAAIKAAASAR